MYVVTFKADVVIIDSVIICLMLHWLIIIYSIRVSLLILTISLGEIKGQMSKFQMNTNTCNFETMMSTLTE